MDRTCPSRFAHGVLPFVTFQGHSKRTTYEDRLIFIIILVVTLKVVFDFCRQSFLSSIPNTHQPWKQELASYPPPTVSTTPNNGIRLNWVRRFLTYVVAWSPLVSFAQMTCGGVMDPIEPQSTSCARSSPDWLNTYRLQSSYVPGAALNSGIVKTIKIAIHIWQKDDGTGNFPQNAATIAGFTQAAADLDVGMWTHNDVPSDPITGTPFIADPGLRAELVGIYFHRNLPFGGTIADKEVLPRIVQ